MKKFIIVALFVLTLAVVVTPAFAFDCKNGNYGSEACWTNVQVSSLETTPVTQGMVLKYAIADGTADQGGFNVRVATATADGNLIAGVAQYSIATGARGNILVRGQGKLLTTGVITSGDRLFAGAAGGVAVGAPTAGAIVSGDSTIAFALTTITGLSSQDQYIVIR